MDSEDGPTDDWQTDRVLKNYPIEKDLSYHETYDGSTSDWKHQIWTYSTAAASGSIVNPDGSSVTNYTGSSAYGSDTGLIYKTVSSDSAMVEKIWGRNYPEICAGTSPCYTNAQANPYVKTEFTSIKDSTGQYTQTAVKDFSYDKDGNVTQVTEFDWVPFSSIHDSSGTIVGTGIPSATPKRVSVTGYNNPTPDAATLSTDSDMYVFSGSVALKNRPAWTEVRDGSNNPVSRTEITYDNAGTIGNPTETKVWDSYKGGASRSYSNPLTSTNSISTMAAYNSCGLPTATTDANGVQTTITYGAIATPTGTISDLYPTKIETASNYAGLKRTSSHSYDFLTGLSLSTTDDDNGITNAIIYDDPGRPVKAITAQGTALDRGCRQPMTMSIE
jgi:hypothetical protein